MKCSACGGLHDVNNTYLWSGDGSQETIWDWLDDVKAEGGTGYAGHNDWRIPNLKELQSIVDYERVSPSIDPIFGSTTAFNYWSSTTSARLTSRAWIVSFFEGFVLAFPESDGLSVRAVRGGPK